MGNSIGFALDVSSKGKLTLFYAQGSAFERYFCYCSALLTDGYFNYAPTGMKWFDDYGIQLGIALNKAVKKADDTGKGTINMARSLSIQASSSPTLIRNPDNRQLQRRSSRRLHQKRLPAAKQP